MYVQKFTTSSSFRSSASSVEESLEGNLSRSVFPLTFTINKVFQLKLPLINKGLLLFLDTGTHLRPETPLWIPVHITHKWSLICQSWANIFSMKVRDLFDAKYGFNKIMFDMASYNLTTNNNPMPCLAWFLWRHLWRPFFYKFHHPMHSNSCQNNNTRHMALTVFKKLMSSCKTSFMSVAYIRRCWVCIYFIKIHFINCLHLNHIQYL